MRIPDLRALAKNPMALLVAAQFFFLCIGIQFLGFDVRWIDVAATLVAGVATELGLRYLTSRKIEFPMSACAAALGIAIFFRSPYLSLFALAGSVAILSKYVVRTSEAHVFNPSNFAIVTIVFLFSGYATVEFTQWGSSIGMHLFIACICFFIAWRAGVIVTTVSFLASYALFFVFLVSYEPDIFAPHHYGLLGPSLVLFASFMITDPKTSPTGTRARLLHGASVAAFYFLLESFGVRYALFVASFGITIGNLASQAALENLARAARWPRNTLTFAAALAGICMLILCVAQGVPHFSPLRLAPSFILSGIESGTLLTCRDPVFRVQKDTGLPASSQAFGAAWGDIDTDGDDDLFVASIAGESALYENGGTFVDVTEKLGLPSLRSSSAYFADYDNDGRLDLFLAPYAGEPWLRSGSDALSKFFESSRVALVRVFRNTGSSFVETTDTIGLDIRADFPTMSALSFADYDIDGDLDLVVSSRGTFLSLNGALEQSALQKSLFDPFFETSFSLMCGEAAVSRLAGYAPKRSLSEKDLEWYGTHRGCFLEQKTLPLLRPVFGWGMGSVEQVLAIPGSLRIFENRGGRFVEHTELNALALGKLPHEEVSLERLRPLDATSGRFFQPLSFDYDGDGLPDIFVAADYGSNLLFKNDGNFRFSDVTEKSGLAITGSGMGADVADYDHDGILDIFVDNVNGDYLFRGTGSGFTLVEKDIDALGIGWGTSFLDYNLDGWDDLMIANGDILATLSEPFGAAGKSFFRADRLYKSDRGELRDATWHDLCPDAQSGMALAVSDYDNDGDPDVFVGNVPLQREDASQNTLYENTSVGAHYIKVRLRGAASNYFGIGAQVLVTSDSLSQKKVVLAGSSFYSGNNSDLLFGLGEDSHADISVRWPSGKVTKLRADADQTLTIRE